MFLWGFHKGMSVNSLRKETSILGREIAWSTLIGDGCLSMVIYC